MKSDRKAQRFGKSSGSGGVAASTSKVRITLIAVGADLPNREVHGGARTGPVC
jgi:hypothetical protein